MENQTNETVAAPVAAPATTQAVVPAFGTLFKQAWATYKANLNTFVLIALVPFVFASIPAFLGSEVAVNPRVIPVFFLLLILSLVASVLGYIALINATIKPGTPEGSFQSSYRASFAYVLSIIWVSILTCLAVMGGFMLLIIPGIIISLLLSFIFFIPMTENKRGMAALVKSWYYTRNNLISLIIRVFIFGLIFAVIGLILSGILFLSGATVTVATPDGITTQLSPVGQAISNILSYLLYWPLYTVFLYEIYKSLRAARPSEPTAEEAARITKKLKIFMVLGIVLPILAFVVIGGIIFTKLKNGELTPPVVQSASVISPVLKIFPTLGR